MAGFIRRFRDQTPPLEVIRRIESVVVVDLTPPSPITGVGSGAVLCFGEFEDGPFATDDNGITQVFGTTDLLSTFGSLGYTYDGVTGNNPSARRHVQELWNGNGFLKLFGLRAQELYIARVDTSVGEVTFSPLACIEAGAPGPFQLSVADVLTVTTELGGPASSDAIAAVVATVLGAAGTYPTGFAGGETFTVRIDGGPVQTITFGAGDQSLAQVITRINDTVGYTMASDNGGELELVGIVQGTSGSLELADGVGTPLASTFGMAPGTTPGTGNVGNLNAVTTTEIAAIFNGTAALTAIGAEMRIGPDNVARACSSAAGTGTINMTSTPMALTMGFSPLGTLVEAGTHPGGTINAGTRVRNAGGDEWVTMQTIQVDEDAEGPFTVKVRPAFDDGTAAGAGATTVNVLVDNPNFGDVTVNNPTALTAAKTEPQMDNAYIDALDASLDERLVSRSTNFSLSARRSDTLVGAGLQNARDASSQGLFGRKFISGSALGTTIANSIAEAESYDHDRLFYTSFGLKVRVPEIAERGTAGGLGFTADGVITVRPDGPLATLCATLPPEDNPGQATGLIEQFFEVDTFGQVANQQVYEAFKAGGVSAPRRDRTSGMTFQSGITTDTTPGRVTMARRKMADFIQDTLAQLSVPFLKKLTSQSVRDALLAQYENFLVGLQSPNAPELARIDDFSIDDSQNAGNTPATEALGVYYVLIKVRTLASMDNIVLVTEIGEGVVVEETELAEAA